MHWSKQLLLLLVVVAAFSCQKITGPVEVHSTKIVFVKECKNQQNIFSMNLDGSDVRQLTFDGNSSLPVFLPVKSTIFYISSGDIFKMNIDGSDKVNLTHSSSTEYEFAVSPDGEKIAFVSDRDQTQDQLYRSEIYLMRSDGTGIKRLTFSKYYSESPTFTPDGSSIAYVSPYNYDPPKFAIHIYSLTDSVDSIFTPNGSSQLKPVFSPHGKWFSYFSRDDYKLYLLNLKTGEQKGFLYGWNPVFSSDDRFLFFLGSGSGGRDIFRYRMEDGSLLNLTNSTVQEKSISLNEDNTKLIFWGYLNVESKQGSPIFLMSLQNNKVVQLTNNDCSNADPIFVSEN